MGIKLPRCCTPSTPANRLTADNPHHTQEKKKKWEPPVPPPRVGRKQRRRDAASGLGSKLPTVTPNAKCKLRLLKLERVKDWLLMEEEFVQNQERQRPQEERNKEDRSKVGSDVMREASRLTGDNHIADDARTRLLSYSGRRPARLADERGQPGGDHRREVRVCLHRFPN